MKVFYTITSIVCVMCRVYLCESMLHNHMNCMFVMCSVHRCECMERRYGQYRISLMATYVILSILDITSKAYYHLSLIFTDTRRHTTRSKDHVEAYTTSYSPSCVIGAAEVLWLHLPAPLWPARAACKPLTGSQ